MKRSDLVKELALEMQNWMTAPSPDNDYISEAGFVLTFLERKGMMPPFNSKYYATHWRNESNGYVWDNEEIEK